MENTKPEELQPKESHIQIAVVDWILKCTDLPVIKIDNEGKRSWFNGYKTKRMGLYPGASDIFIARPTNPTPISPGYPGLWIEFKASEKIKPRKVQIEFMNRMITEGYKAVCLWDVDSAIEFIKSHYGKDLRKFV